MKSNIPRRNFLTAGSISLAAAAAAGPGMSQSQATDSANTELKGERVRFGMIGIGMQGSGLFENAISLPGIECVAAADLYDGRHTLSKQITGNPNLFTTRRYEELLQRK